MKGGNKVLGMRTKVVVSALAVALLVTSSFIFLTDSDDNSTAGSRNPKITYYKNDGSQTSRLITYSGIASTEYNPEFWEGTGHVPAGKELFMKAVVGAGTGNESIEYQSIGTNQITGNREVFVYENSSYRLYDSSIDGTTYNWVGGSVTIVVTQSITLTIESGISGDVSLPDNIIVRSITKTGGTGTVKTVSGQGNENKINCSGITTDVTATLDISVKVNKVFAGWNTSSTIGSGSYYLPGDVVPYAATTNLYAMWVTPDIFTKTTATIQKVNDEVVNDLYCEPYYLTASPLSITDSTINTAGYAIQKTADAGFGSDYDMYKRIYHISGSGDVSFVGTLNKGTYRAHNLSDKAQANFYGGSCGLNGDVVIDNISIYGHDKSKHGVGTNSAIYASGHVLIMGTGVINKSMRTGYEVNVNIDSGNGKGAIQVFGGKSGSSITTCVTSFLSESDSYQKNIVFGSERTELKVKIATCVLIHSGVYSNVAAGCRDGSIGESGGNYLSTYMVIRGGTVFDTVAGGCMKTNSDGTIYGGNQTNTRDDNYYPRSEQNPNPNDTIMTGGTFLYALGYFYTPGDNWQDIKTGIYGSITVNAAKQYFSNILDRSRYYIFEESVVQGGSSHNTVEGSTHLFISDHASLWEAQGGGRDEKSVSVNTYMEMTGESTIRRIACGTITNATTGERDCVRHAHLYVGDKADVANIFGAGFDTWQKPTAHSMKKGSIDIIIKGGKIGDVYGGGYRGSIGTVGDPHVLTIDISISGGEVLGDVYGGGSGGVDKAKHEISGKKVTSSEGDGRYYSTGKSYVYGDISINISGQSIIDGNVYGGGKSIPKLSQYETDYWKYGPDYDNKFYDETEDSKVYITNNDKKDYVATVIGSTSVTVTGGTIKGSVYGGGKGIGTISAGDDFTTFPVLKYDGSYYDLPWFEDGTLTMSYDTSADYLERYKHYAMVVGDTTVTINMPENEDNKILGSVYGGGAQGEVRKFVSSPYTGTKALNGEINVEIISGNIAGSVFGGGYGRSNVVATYGNRTVYVRGGKIGNSVYGGSSDGDDGDPNLTTSKSKVIISDGEIGSSVFGGGFMGVLNGSTEIYVGYSWNGTNAIPLSSSGHEIVIGDSIFAGADVKSGGEPYSSTLVKYGGTVKMSGVNVDIDISGSIMADGNSCLTGSDGDDKIIEIRDFKSDQKLTGIHRADKVTLINCDIKISGKEARFYDGMVKSASLFRIGTLELENGTILSIEEVADDVRSFRSLNASGEPTVMSYPMNKLVFLKGSSFYVREKVSAVDDYKTVDGYAVLAVTDQATFGAYVLGKMSSGGFVTMSDGSYVSAGITDFDDEDVRCWFISGIENKSVTMELNYDSSGSASGYYVDAGVDITKLQKNSAMKYVCGDFVPSISGYNIVKTDFTTSTNYGVKIGSVDATGKAIVYGDNPYGVFYGKNDTGDFKTGEVTGTPGNYTFATSNGNGSYRIDIQMWGHPDNVTLNLGYVVIRVYETSTVTLASGGIIEVIVNETDIRVDLYVKGSGIPASQNVTLNAAQVSNDVKHKGSVDVMIPASMTGYDFTITDVTMGSFDNSDNFTPGGVSFNDIKVSGERNSSNTYGWKSVVSGIVLTNASHTDVTVGTLSGGYPATLRFTLDDYTNDSNTGYKVECSITSASDPTGYTITIYVKVVKQGPVTVTFKKSDGSTIDTVTIDYNSKLKESECPVAGNDFVGWYADINYLNVYDFNTPVIADMSLYARYNYVVTFDCNDGTGYKIYKTQGDNVKVEKPNDPERFGYTFQKWVYQNGDDVVWDEHDQCTITGSVTFYANWQGKQIDLVYDPNNGGSPWTLANALRYGGTFGNYSKQIDGHNVTGLNYWECDTVRVRSETIADRYSVTISWNGDIGTIELTAVISTGKSISIMYNTGAMEVPIDGSWTPQENIWSTNVQNNGSTRVYTYSLTMSGLTYKGYNITKWTIDGHQYDVGEVLTIEVTTTVTTDNDSETITVTGCTINDVAITVSSVVIGNFGLTFTATTEQLDYTMTLTVVHGTITIVSINGNDHPTPSDLNTLHYGDVVTLRYNTNMSDRAYLSSWTSSNGECVIGTPLMSTTTVTVKGSCGITAVEVTTRHFHLDVSYHTETGLIYNLHPSIYVLYDDEDDGIEDTYSLVELSYESIAGTVYTYGSNVDTPEGKYYVYYRIGDTYYLVGTVADSSLSISVDLYTIYFVKHDQSGNVYTDLTDANNLCSSLEGVYGDDDYVTLLTFLVDHSGQTPALVAPVVTIDGITLDSDVKVASYNNANGQITTLHHSDLGERSVFVYLKLNDTTVASGSMGVSVSKRTLYVIAYDTGDNTFSSARMNDCNSDIYSVVVTSEDGILSPTITYSVISGQVRYSIDYKEVILHGKVLPVTGTKASVTAVMTVITNSQIQSLNYEPLSVEEISEMAKKNNDGKVFAVINLTSGRRL